MSTRGLPLQPSLQHLKNEAKQLHKAVLAGDADAATRVRAGLPRIDEDADAAALSDVSLMEAQHVLAREYGYREWAHLVAAAELTFEGLATLGDLDTQMLLRHVDQKDLVVALKLAGDAVKQRMLAGMTDRVRQFISEEFLFLGPVPEDEVRQVQARIVLLTRQLAEGGTISWPPGDEGPPPQPRPTPPLAPALAAVRQPLSALAVDQVRALIHALRAHTGEHGVMSLDLVADGAADPYVAEGLRLASDGTEAALLQDFLRTRARALLQRLENRLLVIIEATMAIRGGDNPRLVTHKLTCVYRDYGEGPDLVPTGASVADLVSQLREHPAASLDLDALTTWLTDVAEIARRQGREALAPLAAAVDDPVLRTGLHHLAAATEMTPLFEAVDRARWQLFVEVRTRLWVFAGGLAEAVSAPGGADLDAAMDAAQRKAQAPA